MKKNTAVIGAGWFGRAHTRVYNSLSNLVAVCDLQKKAAENLSRQYNVNYYVDFEKMLKEEKIDALSVVTPPNSLPDIALACVKAGVDVLMEKPLANSVEKLEPLKD
ncbi:MAG: Gfo/Idh/MocA family protein, partial [Candidatus Ranarchaeia archaeon]